ncbi:hypothetical protein [Cupriavidus basilensis]|uniref:hypothetical protein n=1 Tax=Cupriavidus basilensis TaxID=68895 RepID=UPI00069738AF|nr:hypothetical protein [Cupriavidus basilensis]
MPTSIPLTPTVTADGLTALFNAQNTGVELAITHIALGTGQYVPDGTEHALQNEKLRLPIAGGGRISPTQIQVYASGRANAGQPFWSGEIGFYAGSILFAVYGRTAAPSLYVSDEISTTISYSLGFKALPPDSITVTVDPNAASVPLLIGQHVIDPNAHPQYAPLDSPTFINTPRAPTQPASDNSTLLATTAFAQGAIAAAILADTIGRVFFSPRTTAPAGSIKLNGVLLLRANYPALWQFAQASGNLVSEAAWPASPGSFSTGDGATTFRVPEVRGEFIRALDDARGVDSGRIIGSWQGSQNLSHAHGAYADVQGYHSHGATTSYNGDHNHSTSFYRSSLNNHYGGEPLDPALNPTSDPIYTSTNGGHVHSIIGDGSHNHNITVYADGSGEARSRNVAWPMFMRAY